MKQYSTLCAAGLLLVLAILCGISARNETLTYDEPAHLAFAERSLSGTLDHADMQKMPVIALNAIPVKVGRAIGLSISPGDAEWISRMPTMLCAVALGWFVFMWARQLYGAKGGLLSLFLFVFCPTLAAHGRLITTDLYCALFSFLAVFAFAHYMERRSWPRLMLAAVAMGASQLTKQTALLLLPVLLMVFILRRYATGRRNRAVPQRLRPGRLATDALHGACYLLIGLVVINAGYGFNGTFETLETHQKWLASNQFYVRPVPRSGVLAAKVDEAVSRIRLPLPRAYVEAFLLGQFYNRTGLGHGPVYLFGKRSQLGWPYYFPLAFLLKTPLPTLGLLALALVVPVRTRRLRLESDAFPLLCSALALFVYFSFFCTAQVGIRYLLPALPFLYVFAGRLVSWAPQSGWRQWRAGLLILLLWLSVSVLSYFPHYISYFNEICWNRLRLYKYLADSNLDWGQDGYYLERYLMAHRGQRITINPASPTTGTVIVSVNNLVGAIGDPATYQWLREEYEPSARVAYSWLVYEIPEFTPR